MADRRSERAAVRRKTPTPQPPSRGITPRPARTSRARQLRSASREVEPLKETAQPLRRSARQASVSSAISASEDEGQVTRKTKRRPIKETIEELTVVEEVEDFVDARSTPLRTEPEVPVGDPSPGAASQMSGTTAITSFSIVEAEFLEPKFMLRHLRKLCDSADEFLEHLAPVEGSIEDDMRHIHEIQKPDSDFADEYRDFDSEINVHLKHFKTEDQDYIHKRTVQRALFGSNRETIIAPSGLDLVLYLANLLIFAKHMIHSDRNSKAIWEALQQLDNSFPNHFAPSFSANAESTAAGESALLKETFDLALDLRTQLAILALERASTEENFEPDETLGDVFFLSDAQGPVIRGWNIAALGGQDAALPQSFRDFVIQRLNKIREFFPTDVETLAQGDVADLDGLGANFPWEATILRLLHWVRLRHRELSAIINELGGAATIVKRVKADFEAPKNVKEQVQEPQRNVTPRKKRLSFGRDRRRSSRKFDPNAPVDLQVLDALKARERLSGARRESSNASAAQANTSTLGDNLQPANPQVADQDYDMDDAMPQVGDEPEIEQPAELEIPEKAPVNPQAQGEKDLVRTVGQLAEQQAEDDFDVQFDNQLPSEPPQTSAEILKALKSVSKSGKENRALSIFDRQPNAQRIEFGDGFDESQPTPGPSHTQKGKQPAQSSPRKRRRDDIANDSDSDAFEVDKRPARVQERRSKAPAPKRVRIEPSSSGVPPSHQPPRPSGRIVQDITSSVPDPTPPVLERERRQERVDRASDEPAAPRHSIAASFSKPQSSTYQAQRLLATQNSELARRARIIGGIGSTQQATGGLRNERKPRTAWSTEAEEVFMEYMEMFPAQYSAIQKYDASVKGKELLLDRTQVNLKDKARTMAVNMIKSGCGLRPGFEDIVKPTSKEGIKLLDLGFTW